MKLQLLTAFAIFVFSPACFAQQSSNPFDALKNTLNKLNQGSKAQQKQPATPAQPAQKAPEQPQTAASAPPAAPEQPLTQEELASGVGPDVIGLRLGMRPKVVYSIMQARGFGARQGSPNRFERRAQTLAYRDPAGQLKPVPGGAYLDQIFGFDREPRPTAQLLAPAHEMNALFAPLPGREVLLVLTRAIGFDREKMPTYGNFRQALIEKYGPPVMFDAKFPAIFQWTYDSSGKPAAPRKPEGTCIGLAHDVNGVQGAYWVQRVLPERGLEKLADRCGSIYLAITVSFLDVNYKGPDTLIDNQRATLVGIEASVRANRAAHEIITNAEQAVNKAAVNQAKKQKPDL